MDVFLLRSETRTNVRPSFTTNFVRFIVEPRWGTKFVVLFNPVCAVRHWALEWNCVAVHSSVASFNPSYVDLSSYLGIRN